MIKINRKTDYALRAIIYLGQKPKNSLHFIEQIAKACGVNHYFMSKILKELSIRELVKSHKGVHGGYRLVKDVNTISFKEVIEIIEGPILISDCLSGDKTDCQFTGNCSMQEIWREVNQAICKLLEEKKVGHLSHTSKFDFLDVDLLRKE